MNDSERPHAFQVQFNSAFFRYISAALAKKSALSLKQSATDFGFHCFVLDCS